jgi:hypothetical protein
MISHDLERDIMAIHRHLNHGLIVLFLLASLGVQASPAYAEVLAQGDVFVGGAEGPQGTSNYRIPSFTVAANGDLLAFIEARRSSVDPGQAGFPINMAMKRSVDGGQTWIDYTVLHANAAFDYSDPRAVVDENTGTVHLLYTQWPDDCGQSCVGVGMGDGLGDDSSQTFHQFSTDSGLTWSWPSNITAQVKNPTWEMINTGPGIAIQLRYQDANPARNGRLVIPGHRRDGNGTGRNTSIYSDDGGATWQTGGPVSTGSSEAEVVELTNGQLLMDIRRTGFRKQSLSSDGGATWGTVFDGDISMTAVDAGLLRYSATRDSNDRDRILFSGPLGSPAGAGNNRTNIGVWTSYDEGQTFINPVQLDSGHGAYSALEKLNDGSIGLIWEATGSTSIQYAGLDIAELEGANHHPLLSHYDGFGNQVDAFRGGMGWSGAWNNSGATVEAGDLAFPDFAITGDAQRGHLRDDTMARNLGTGLLDLNQNQDYYLSMFVNHDSADGSNSSSGEFLDIVLVDSDNRTQAAFGIGSNENFFVSELAGVIDSADGAAVRDDTYLLLVKLAAQDGQAGNFDQLFFAWFDDAAQVPDDETQINWQLVGGTSENLSSSIKEISISAGSNADWLVDGLRIGSSFEAVMATDPLLGDLNFDGAINLADWLEFRGDMSLSTIQLTEFERLHAGDFNSDGRVGPEDYIDFVNLYDEANGLGAFSDAQAQVPEPSTVAMLFSAITISRYLFKCGNEQIVNPLSRVWLRFEYDKGTRES